MLQTQFPLGSVTPLMQGSNATGTIATPSVTGLESSTSTPGKTPYGVSVSCTTLLSSAESTPLLSNTHETPPGVPTVVARAGIDHLCQMFPHISQSALQYIYELSRANLASECDCILCGPSLDSLVSLISSRVLTNEVDERTLRIDSNEQEGDELVECVLAFYKGPRYDPHCGVRVFLSGQPAVDTGGVRRQVFSHIFERLAFSDRLSLFDGPPDRRRPAYRISSLSAGVMRLVGRMLGHSIILDQVGFPYLSPTCYYAMVGDQDQALLLCTPEDASERVQLVLKEVCSL